MYDSNLSGILTKKCMDMYIKLLELSVSEEEYKYAWVNISTNNNPVYLINFEYMSDNIIIIISKDLLCKAKFIDCANKEETVIYANKLPHITNCYNYLSKYDTISIKDGNEIINANNMFSDREWYHGD